MCGGFRPPCRGALPGRKSTTSTRPNANWRWPPFASTDTRVHRATGAPIHHTTHAAAPARAVPQKCAVDRPSHPCPPLSFPHPTGTRKSSSSTYHGGDGRAAGAGHRPGHRKCSSMYTKGGTDRWNGGMLLLVAAHVRLSAAAAVRSAPGAIPIRISVIIIRPPPSFTLYLTITPTTPPKTAVRDAGAAGQVDGDQQGGPRLDGGAPREGPPGACLPGPHGCRSVDRPHHSSDPHQPQIPTTRSWRRSGRR